MKDSARLQREVKSDPGKIHLAPAHNKDVSSGMRLDECYYDGDLQDGSNDIITVGVGSANNPL